MKKLIELDSAIEAMAELQGRAASKAELTGISKAWKRIKALPFVVPVPMVRCGFCRYFDSIGYCALHQTEMCETDFCSYGKKDGDGNGID